MNEFSQSTNCSCPFCTPDCCPTCGRPWVQVYPWQPYPYWPRPYWYVNTTTGTAPAPTGYKIEVNT